MRRCITPKKLSGQLLDPASPLRSSGPCTTKPSVLLELFPVVEASDMTNAIGAARKVLHLPASRDHVDVRTSDRTSNPISHRKIAVCFHSGMPR
jgi:hypothetical protein